MDNSTGGIGFLGVLQVAFIVLKLCHVIEWSWVWVLAPIWIFTLAAFTVIFGFLGFCILKALK